MQRSPFQLGLGAGLLALLVIALAPHDASAKKKKSAEPVAPKLGWVQEEGWKNACYYPPDWASLDEIPSLLNAAEFPPPSVGSQ